MATFVVRLADFLDRWKTRRSRGLAMRPWNSCPKRMGLEVSVTPVVSTYIFGLVGFEVGRYLGKETSPTFRRTRGSILETSGSPASAALAFRSSHCSFASSIRAFTYPFSENCPLNKKSDYLCLQVLCNFHLIIKVESFLFCHLVQYDFFDYKRSDRPQWYRRHLEFLPLNFQQGYMS